MTTSRREFLQLAAAAGAAASATLLLPGFTRRAFGRVQLEGVAKANKPLKILILGGTGFLGPATVEYALARGHELTLFNRGRTNADLFPELERIVGNRDPNIDEGLTNIKAEIDAGRTWDAVIDNSAYVPRVSGASAELLAPAVDSYVFISTACVYDNWTGVKGGTEAQPLARLDDPTTEEVRQHYCALKGYCEEAVSKYMGGRETLIRPGLIVGPRDGSDRFTYWPVRVSKGGEVLAPGTPNDPLQFIDVRDLGKFIVHTIEYKKRGAYNALGPQGGVPMGKFLEVCKDVSGSDATFTWCDAEFLREQNLRPWAELPMWADPSDPEMGGVNQWDISKSIEAGLTFRPVEETVRGTLDWWKTLPEERRSQLRAGMSAEQETAALKAWHER